MWLLRQKSGGILGSGVTDQWALPDGLVVVGCGDGDDDNNADDAGDDGGGEPVAVAVEVLLGQHGTHAVAHEDVGQIGMGCCDVLAERLGEILAIMRRDDRRAWTLGADGEWTRVASTIDGEPTMPVRAISTDSRNVEPGAVFVALRGVNHDGHDHAVDCSPINHVRRRGAPLSLRPETRGHNSSRSQSDR